MSYEKESNTGWIVGATAIFLTFVLLAMIVTNHYNNERIRITNCNAIARNVNEFNACVQPTYYRTDGTSRGS